MKCLLQRHVRAPRWLPFFAFPWDRGTLNSNQWGALILKILFFVEGLKKKKRKKCWMSFLANALIRDNPSLSLETLGCLLVGGCTTTVRYYGKQSNKLWSVDLTGSRRQSSVAFQVGVKTTNRKPVAATTALEIWLAFLWMWQTEGFVQSISKVSLLRGPPLFKCSPSARSKMDAWNKSHRFGNVSGLASLPGLMDFQSAGAILHIGSVALD